MKYLQKLFSRHFYRSALFWVTALIGTYSIVGFLVVPKIIHKNIVEQVDLNLGWQTEIQKIEFNPFALTLSIIDLKILDKQAQQQLSFARYDMDFELRSIVEGAFTFANVELLEPSISVEIDKDGMTNFHRALREQQSKVETPPESTNENNNEDNTVPGLLFDNISVINGSIDVVNNSASKPVNHQLNPITFNLKDLSTNLEREGNYQLNIALGSGQTLDWNGTVALAPFRSTGSLEINGIMVHKLWNYMPEQVPYTLQNGLAGFSGKYEVSLANESPHLKMYQSLIEINDIKLGNKQQEDSFAEIQTIQVGPLDFDLAEQTLQITTVKVDAANLKLERDNTGLLNILPPPANTEQTSELSSETTSEPKPEQLPEEVANSETDNTNSEWQWSIDEFILNDSQVNFIDQQPATKAEIAINKINLKVEDINPDLSQPLPFQITYHIDQSPENTVQGQVTPTPLKLQANLALNDFSLPTIQPYLNELVRINLEQGKLSAKGNLSLSTDANGEMLGGFEGAFAINEFNSKDKTLNQRLVGWQALQIDPITVNFNPLSIHISNVALTKPYLRLIVTEDRSINFAQLAINNEQTSKVAPPKSEDTEQQKPLDLKIDKISLEDGSAYFADLSLTPEFGTSIQNMNGQIMGLSSDNLARADVDITGSIEEYGKLLVKGQINPLGGDLYTDLNANFEKIELTTLTPYSGRYTGYVIDKGKLSLNLNYKIANNQLDGSNRLILDQLELGSSVNSEESLDLPLKLALALFTDSDGIIDISLQTKGDMDDPDFAFGGLVLKAFLNIMTKAVASPFSMIANLAEGEAEKLNSLAFNLGSSKLSEDNIAQLNTIAKLLNERPQLILEIRALVDEEQDGLALKQQKLDILLEKSNIDDLPQPQRIPLLEELLISQNGGDELTKLKSEMQTTIKAEQQPEQKSVEGDAKTEQEVTIVETTVNDYEKALYQTLLNKQPLRSLELSNLAQERISAIKGQLIKNNKVQNGQVFALQPSIDGKAEQGTVATVFTLNAN